MSLCYDDLNDLIQNQRALAELVGQVKDQYDDLQIDIAFARELETRINGLNDSLSKLYDDFEIRIAQSDQRMQTALDQVTRNAQELKDAAETWVNTLKATDGSGQTIGTIQQLVSVIEAMSTLVYQGLYDPVTDTYSGGLEEMFARIKVLESKTPSIVIMPEGVVIPMKDRIQGVLYGRISGEVRDIEAGQALRLGPNIRGVIQ